MHDKVGKDKDENKEIIKKLIKKLHAGEDPVEVKKEFKEVIKNMTSLQITNAEELLIKEGMPIEEIHHMCDVHLAVLEETLTDDINLAPEGHPVNILMQEHAILLKYANELRDLYKNIKEKSHYNEIPDEFEKITSIIDHFKASSSHYAREENILFSYLEKHGVVQPPKIMWIDHDRIRDIEKNLYSLLEKKNTIQYADFVKTYHEYAHGLSEMLASHFSKENKVLFPTAMQVCTKDEWIEIRRQFDDIGYCCFTPELPDVEQITASKTLPTSIDDKSVNFGTGVLTFSELKMLFKVLPVDITYVGKDNTVKFYSEGDRIFPRAPSIVGRLVENCHPDKSVDRVLEIIEGFRDNSLDKAEFWLEVGGRMIFIRYFPVRNSKGEYEGVLEVTQDITNIRKIEGEKRLL
ncbi:MAG: DUF438 domain-containing protein [Candidatus Heimdallarchaeota archaeon]|nr:DUF438 domain-containing protein [Candidatus Heimdallarchaeota archaeon]